MKVSGCASSTPRHVEGLAIWLVQWGGQTHSQTHSPLYQKAASTVYAMLRCNRCNNVESTACAATMWRAQRVLQQRGEHSGCCNNVESPACASKACSEQRAQPANAKATSWEFCARWLAHRHKPKANNKATAEQQELQHGTVLTCWPGWCLKAASTSSTVSACCCCCC